MEFERNRPEKKYLEVGQGVPLSIHYVMQGDQPLETLCPSTTGNNPNAGVITHISGIEDADGIVRRGVLGMADCSNPSCDYSELMILNPETGRIVRSSTLGTE